METVEKYYDTLIAYAIKYGFQVLFGIIILFVGWKIAEWVSELFANLCRKRHLDVTLTKFLSMVVKIIVLMFAILIAMDKFGITISPFIATISAMIFGASFAIQAPLSNYAAGLSIIFTRPFVVGNTITIKGYNGVVDEIKLPATILSTGDGERITIPNKDIVGEVIVNSMENRVAETSVGISYGDDPEAAILAVRRALAQFPQILKTPEPRVGIQSFGDSAIVIGVRYFAPTKLFVVTLQAVNLAIFKALKDAKISIPYPQRDVRIVHESK
jgi:small conductance mechanosensitive channel